MAGFPTASATKRDEGEASIGQQLQTSRERVRWNENEALQKLRRLDGERLFTYHREQ